MVTREDLESFLIRMDMDWNEVDEGMFLVQSPSGGVVVHFSDPVLLVRLKVMDLPNGESDLAELYRALLELNATDIVHGAYGIENGELILSDTLELQTLDFEELQASVESLQYAAATSRFAFASCSRMSRMIWFSIFSGSSAREMRSFMFDLMTVESLVKMPMR